MKNKNNFKAFGFFIGIIILAVCSTFFVIKIQNHNIDEWIKDHNYTEVNREMCWNTIGTPFYYCGKGQSIYKLTLKKNNKREIWYVRTNWNYEYVKQN